MSEQSITQLLHAVTPQSFEQIKKEIELAVNDLLLNDFQRLVQILYQVDVDEQKLRKILAENKDADAAVVITTLLINRQLEKVKSRSQFKSDSDISDEDRW